MLRNFGPTMTTVPVSPLLLLVLVVSWVRPEAGSEQQQAALGRAKFTELSAAASRPSYGQCWTRALAKLETTCDHLTDDSHSR